MPFLKMKWIELGETAHLIITCNDLDLCCKTCFGDHYYTWKAKPMLCVAICGEHSHVTVRDREGGTAPKQKINMWWTMLILWWSTSNKVVLIFFFFTLLSHPKQHEIIKIMYSNIMALSQNFLKVSDWVGKHNQFKSE